MNCCKQCGAELQESWTFCQGCGVHIAQKEEVKVENSNLVLVYQKIVANKIVRFTISGVRLIWPFFRLFAVALAWGAPFIILLGANASQAANPKLAQMLEALWGLLLLLAPFFAIVGVVTVEWLSKQVSPLSDASALALLGLCLAAGGTALVTTGELLGVIFVTPVLLAVGTPILGAAVTAVSLWRYRRWLAMGWVFGFILMVREFEWLASQTQTADDLGAGIKLVFGISLLLQVSFIGSMLTLMVNAWLTKRRHPAECL